MKLNTIKMSYMLAMCLGALYNQLLLVLGGVSSVGSTLVSCAGDPGSIPGRGIQPWLFYSWERCNLGGVKNGGSTTWFLWSYRSCRLFDSGHCDVIRLAGWVDSRCMLHNGFDELFYFDCFDAIRHINQRSGQFQNTLILNIRMLLFTGNHRKIYFPNQTFE